MMHVLCSNEPLPTFQVKYILCPRGKAIIVALPLYKMFGFTPALTCLQHSFNLINIVFFQNLLQFRFVEFACIFTPFKSAISYVTGSEGMRASIVKISSDHEAK